MKRFAIGLFALLALAGPASAIDADEILADPALEQRARDIGRELRCLVCQNQSIFDSNAGLAKDLRVVVRERVVAGDSDEETLAFVVERYGDYVLLEPPMNSSTLLLWAAPWIAMLVSLGGGVMLLRVRGRSAPKLAEGDAKRARALLSEDRS